MELVDTMIIRRIIDQKKKKMNIRRIKLVCLQETWWLGENFKDIVNVAYRQRSTKWSRNSCR